MEETLRKSGSEIYSEIKDCVESLFGITIHNPISLELGFMNLKWKVDSDRGQMVIKQFSKERFERYDLDQVSSEQEFALQEQVRQFEHGTLCPMVFLHKENAIQKTPSGERFVLMNYMPGRNLSPGTLNEKQMFHLGMQTGHIHAIANDGTYTTNGTPKFVPSSLEVRLNHWETLLKEVEIDESFSLKVKEQLMATEQFHLGLIASCETGWAHRDLWVDNVLFNEDQVSAILDFDRFEFDYPELDIARAVMSGALNGLEFNFRAARAFLEGYRTKRNLPEGRFARSLYLLWYLESEWWIVPHLNRDRYQEAQFQDEMIWLADHLTELQSMFGDW